jgi:hypothetical protein
MAIGAFQPNYGLWRLKAVGRGHRTAINGVWNVLSELAVGTRNGRHPACLSSIVFLFPDVDLGEHYCIITVER